MPAVILVFPHRGREVVSALLTGITQERLDYGWFHEEEEVDEKEEEVEVGSMVAEGDVYRSRGVDVVSVQRNRHVTVCLESDMGDIAEVTVVKDVGALAEVSTYGEAIHEETVEQMVVRALRAYALSDEVLKHVKAEVVRTLYEEGVRFSEE